MQVFLRSRVVLLLGILVLASTLRAPVTVVGPLLQDIRQAFGMGSLQAGLLTALPVLAFAAMSPIAQRLARAHGLERALFGAVLLIAGGVLLRSSGPAWALFAGTWCIGSGIAFGNVLLPSLLRRDFPQQRIPTLTALYMLVTGVSAAVASAVAVPVAHFNGLGWPGALDCVLLLPVLALLLWLPQLAARQREAQGAPGVVAAPLGGAVWRAPLAWQIACFLGINSFLYYGAVSWLPAVLVAAGYSQAEAGSLHGLHQLSPALPGLVLVPLGRYIRDSRPLALGAALLTACGLAGLALQPAWAAAWVVVQGFGTGAGLIIGISYVGLRAANAQQVAELSGMAQCVGYTLGALGPSTLGLLHDVQGGWLPPLFECALLALVMGGLGWLAGRERMVA